MALSEPKISFSRLSRTAVADTDGDRVRHRKRKLGDGGVESMPCWRLLIKYVLSEQATSAPFATLDLLDCRLPL